MRLATWCQHKAYQRRKLDLIKGGGRVHFRHSETQGTAVAIRLSSSFEYMFSAIAPSGIPRYLVASALIVFPYSSTRETLQDAD